MRKLLLALLVTILLYTPAQAKKPTHKETPVATSDSGGLTLDDVIRQSVEYSPQLRGLKDGIDAEKGSLLQAGKRPNPVLSFEAENIFGNKSNSGTRSAEYTAGVQQTLEMGGKRAARAAVGGRKVDLAGKLYGAGGVDVVKDITLSWAQAVSSQEKLKVAEKQKKLSGEMLKSVSDRVAAAAEPGIQRSKAEVAYNNSIIELEKARLDYKAAKNALSISSGLPSTIRLDSKSFYKIAPAPAEAGLERSPELAARQSQTEVAKAALELEKANAAQDITFGVGVRDSRDSNAQSFVGSISIPFPLFNRNEGEIARAAHEQSRAEHELRQAKNDMQAGLATALANMDSAYIEAKELKAKILPSAEKAFSQAREGYKAGRYPYLDVLDAQRTLSEMRVQYIEAVKTYQLTKAEVDRMTGRHAGLIVAEGEQK